MDFIVNGEWNLSADLPKLSLPYSVVIGDSIIAVIWAPESTERCLVRTAHHMRVGLYERRWLRVRDLPKRTTINCAISKCPNQVAVSVHLRLPTPHTIFLCEDCADSISEIIMANKEEDVMIGGDHLLIHNRQCMYLKQKCRWRSNIRPHPKYKNEIIGAIVNFHYPMWFLIGEMRELPDDLVRYIMLIYLDVTA